MKEESKLSNDQIFRKKHFISRKRTTDLTTWK